MLRALYDDDHEIYRETVREFLAREVVPHQHDWDDARWIDRTVYARAAKAGLYGLQIDERFGGSGEHDYRYRMVVCEEVARINALSFGLTVSLQEVPEPRVGKNRVHLDLEATDRSAEVARLVDLGAVTVREHTYSGYAWTVLEDPEGNVFCVSGPPTPTDASSPTVSGPAVAG